VGRLSDIVESFPDEFVNSWLSCTRSRQDKHDEGAHSINPIDCFHEID
jgi:hypothetical protein